uniref:Uncharacterized protein n=1 Tax=Prymnesium polylepis TaxID=72548 RepID=A0A6V4VXK1_9EUKA|mmetsp:Transcript_23113/g.57081  ORF Transcript_23113/g.57081 Transcript_23113/m.57081 type:complete len:532 (+) Transcript_23113:98-1693(+)
MKLRTTSCLVGVGFAGGLAVCYCFAIWPQCSWLASNAPRAQPFSDADVDVHAYPRRSRSAQLMATRDSSPGRPSEAVVYSIIVDCGSSGSRAHIYHWSHDDRAMVAEFLPPSAADEAALKVRPGIGALLGAVTANVSAMDDYLLPLLHRARQWAPSGRVLGVRLLATAGMRLLSADEQETIWAAVRRTLRAPQSAQSFRLLGAMTISGNYEGVFGYLAVNHIVRSQRGESSKSDMGSLDLGGASTQITFQPAPTLSPHADILADGYRVNLSGASRVLYSHSFMRSGDTQAWLRLARLLLSRSDTGASTTPVSHPCLHRGHEARIDGHAFVGTGDWRACSTHAQQLLHIDYECLQQPCALAGVYQPRVRGVTFVAFSGFFHIVHGLGLTTGDVWKGTVGEIARAGEALCEQTWSLLLETHPWRSSPAHMQHLCFGAAYIEGLLRGYGFSEPSAQLTFARKLAGYAVEWPLGAQIFYNTDPHHRDERLEEEAEASDEAEEDVVRGLPRRSRQLRRRRRMRRRIRRLGGDYPYI